ncbi:MAG: Rieske 2Fe-2S domain-containing protein [Burkholderiales bacterium]|nr:Rieske 2Fe-2S domain-containing protein [Burkholderiales bacterium]
MDRRDFIRICTAGAGMAGTVPDRVLAAPTTLRPYRRARLLDDSGKPLRAATIAAQRNYVFFYPYRGTPCFLLNLGRPLQPAHVSASSDAYAWPGGVGTNRSLVAYSAICSHQLTYPTREISFISFRAGKQGANRHGDVIHCCSEHSQYDPAQGARVVAGPAPRPLAAVVLEHEPATDGLYATATLGQDLFEEFFRKYEFRLTMEHGGAARRDNSDNCRVTELENYCRQQVRC